jgi:MinD-like ATPase involved in chromosome partitioning or flagellar assembly
MVVSGADDQDEPEPEPDSAAVPAPGTEHGAPREGVPNWPASGLPPSFGQRSTEGERPAVASPGPGPGYGGYRPLGSLPPSGPLPGAPAWHQASGDWPESEARQHETDGGPAGPSSHGEEQGPPWETYETGEGYGWTGGYGVVPEQGEPQPERGERQWQAESADSLTADVLLPGRHAAPASGWRRALYQVTGGLVRAPQSAADRRRTDLVQRARTPIAAGHHRVAVLSLKGGVGKTTTTVGLGSTLASLRGDRVIAVDANPDRGTLSDKLRLETAATVRDLLNEEDQIRRYADVRAYTTQSHSGLEVLASDRDPTVSVAFSDQDYVDVARVLEHYYSVSITDCGTGLLHSAMAGVLRLADQIVLVSSPSVDGARSASATLDWLAAHNYGDLVRGAVVVLSAIRPRSKSAVDLARLEQHFAARCRAVVRIPYDAHLEEGAEVDLAQLSRATADSYLVLAAEVGDGFSWPRH